MTNKAAENISTLMDGETELVDAGFLNNPDMDAEATGQWQRYHLIRDAMHGNLPEQINPQLFKAIQSSIADEPTILAPKRKQPPALLKPIAGLAIAASVMAAVLLGVQTFQATDTLETENSVLAINQSGPTAPNASFVSFDENSNEATDQAEQRINRYIMNYNEHKASNGVRSVPPYARMVGYEAQ